MWPVFATLVAVLLSCSNGFETIQNGNKIDTYQSEELALNFIELNSDVLYIILNGLEIDELLIAAEAMPELSPIIGEVFRRKFVKNEPIIKIKILNIYNYRMNFMNNNTINIVNRQQYVKLLKYFGRYIPNISINYPSDYRSDMGIIGGSLNKYCLKHLKHLKLNIDNSNDFTGEFTMPFEGVEQFSISATALELTRSKPLNVVFPNLNQLNLKLGIDMNLKFIDETIPKLSELRISIEQKFNEVKRTNLIEQFTKIIMKNPTIGIMKFNIDYPEYFLKNLSQHLPNLEHLRLEHFQIKNGDTVQFQNLNILVLSVRHPNDIRNLENLWLPKLELFVMVYEPGYLDKWTKFLKNHTHLKDLSVLDVSSLLFSHNIPELNELVADLSNLQNLTIFSDRYYGNEPIVQFIQGKRQFENVEFIFPARSMIETEMVTDLQQQLYNEWTVEEYKIDDPTLTGFKLEYKQPTPK